MNEFDTKKVEEFVEQDVSEEEIDKKAEEFINKGRGILFLGLNLRTQSLRNFFIEKYVRIFLLSSIKRVCGLMCTLAKQT